MQTADEDEEDGAGMSEGSLRSLTRGLDTDPHLQTRQIRTAAVMPERTEKETPRERTRCTDGPLAEHTD
eukprot:760664-Hanusia_phi.AAC.7